ncbi:C4-dicarboxylate ABC transporter substrate-binding protein [Psychromonas sp. MB-3u-54]|uniref:TRAP transporter substrate-binding protein DctP n=1 Tax=Psychromonas sp. MB-3u-54 TaxID=2058319 RepID=UPI000C3317BB|nr:TRAP transporter substrate-binding protein DctP [Psychromonas sp. MB-3u-54]PKH03335.1 C4-dicarboxylate ABC transporter substrate-binding protein [Psychromonas sp. MB-3u-54]
MFEKSNDTKKFMLIASTLTAALTFSALDVAAADNQFMFSQPFNADHIFHHTSEKFIEKLADEDSSYKPDYHLGGDLGDWTSQFEQAMMGVIPMTITYGASEFDGRLDLTWLGYVVDDWESARKVYGPGGPMLDVYNNIFADMGLVALGTIPTGFGSITIRKGVDKVPTTFPEDAKGIKMRVIPSPLAIERFNNWGFSAVPMPYSELYTALQLGTVDGRAFGPAVEIWQMRDVLQAYILTRDYFEHAFWLVNKDWWEGLPAAERQKMQIAVDETLDWAWQEAERIDNEFLEKVRDYGIDVVELSDEDLTKAKDILYSKEWPFMEKKVGKEIMTMMREIADIK